MRAFTSSRSSRNNFTSNIARSLRHFKSVFDMLHHRLAAGPRNADHIEPCVALVQFSFGQENTAPPESSFAACEFHRFERRAEAVAGAGLHLDKYHHAPVENDQVELSAGAAIVSLDDLVAFCSEIRSATRSPSFPKSVCRCSGSCFKKWAVFFCLGDSFAYRSKAPAVYRRRAITAQAVEMCFAAVAFVFGKSVFGIPLVQLRS